jgi:hypothetical protein
MYPDTYVARKSVDIIIMIKGVQPLFPNKRQAKLACQNIILY